MRRTGEQLLLVSAAVYGVSTTVSVVALRVVRPVDLLAVEITGAAAMLMTSAAARGRLRRRGALRQMLLGALVPGLAFLFGDLGLARTSASSGSLLLAAEPLLSVLLAVVVLRERLSRGAAIALIAGLAGSGLVALGSGTSGDDTTLGNTLVLLAVLAAAVFLIATRRFNGNGAGLNESAWQSTGGALSVVPFVAASWSTGGTRLDTVGVAGWAACIAVVLCGAAGSVTFNQGIARVPAARAAQLGNLTPVVGTLTAVLFLGDRPALLQLAGGAAILAGLALLLYEQDKPAFTDRPHRPVSERSMS
ncbi:DMT family transporter [Actinoplanes sp. CA-142083]|uniref:DMT family transporter n=1 Tax=Actinoplanes sp. CA-142083 TaxID=3239903 RepID=UPI003D907642